MAPSTSSSGYLSIGDELEFLQKADVGLSKFARQQQSNADNTIALHQGESFGDYSANEEHKAKRPSIPAHQLPATATPKKAASHIGEQYHSPMQT
jgi:hypothetical protein